MGISAKLVKELRDKTGAGMMDCKKALGSCDGDIDKAVDHLRSTGIAKAEKKSGREAKEGAIYSYIHPGSKLGVLVQVNCETDFVANTKEFKSFVKDIAMQIAASDPKAISREELDPKLIEREKAVYKEQIIQQGKPEHIAEKIIIGKMGKYYKENVLLEQEFIKDSDQDIETYLKETISKLGENINISKFARFQLG
ncbi:MAG: translation elongation factor Ts [Candidatus Marinimicrobia bacterium]|jgi:elongation factor Ts|nr:translation elongation factor Ts [Candidatus Neomarinimicrobiota bacterium]